MANIWQKRVVVAISNKDSGTYHLSVTKKKSRLRIGINFMQFTSNKTALGTGSRLSQVTDVLEWQFSSSLTSFFVLLYQLYMHFTIPVLLPFHISFGFITIWQQCCFMMNNNSSNKQASKQITLTDGYAAANKQNSKAKQC